MINNTYNLKGLFDVSDILKNMGAVQDEFNKLGTDHNITESINKSFRSLREEIQNFDVLLGSADSTKGMKQIEQAFTRLQHHSTLLQQNLSDLNIPLKNINFDVLGKELETNLRAASAAFESAEEDVKKYGRQIENLQKMMKDKFNVTTSTLDIGGGVKKAIRDNLQSYEDLVRIKDDYNTKTKEEIAASKSAAGVISKEIDSAKERKLVLGGQKTEQEELVKIASEIVIEREAEVASINRQITALGSLNEQLRKKRELERGKEEKPGQIEKAIEAQKKAQEALDVAKGSGASDKEIKVLERELKKATENTEKLKKGLEEIETRYERILEVEKQREGLEKEKAEREKVLRESKEDLSKEEEAQKRIAEEIKNQNKVIDDKVNAHKREQSAGEALADTQTKVNKVIDDAIIDAKNLNQVKEEAAEKTEVLERAQENLNEAYKEATKVGAEKLAEGMEKVNNAMGNMSGPIKQSVSAHEELDAKTKKLDSTFQGLIGRVEMYLGTMAILSQIGKAVRSAVQDFKDFDAAFTEIAVVTNLSVNELWGSFDRYNELAAKLGTTTNNAIKTSALFYQQGLSTSEVWKVTEETMKMATIAGIDFADATRKMTAALRGFSMTVDQAGHVNDVFSTLAAKAAVDTAGLATALSKTASIADNAGMSFENTSAFLAKMQETTQEAAENIGTSMKTIVARFTELKQSPLDLTIEVEGEIVDANRVEAALRLAGVDLRDATGQFRDLDDVFLDLGGRWKSLDRLTQRYIATTAAGSRQQSRFIALMEDHERTLELVGLAHDATGQSALQFSKTLEGFEAKINQLKAAWEKLYTNFLSSQFFKDAIDGITNVINRLSDMPPLLAVIVSVISISVIKNIISSFLSGIKTVTQGIGDVRQEFSAAKVDWSKPIKLFFSDNLDQVSNRVNAVKAGANVPASVAPVGGVGGGSLPQDKVVGGSSMLASLKSSVGGAVASGVMAGLATGLTTGNASTGLKTGLAATALQLFSSKAVTTAIVTGVKAIGTAIIANPLIAVGVVAAAGLAWITKALIDSTDTQKQLEREAARAKREYEKASAQLEEKRNIATEKSNELKNIKDIRAEYEKYSNKVSLTTEEQQKYNDLISQIEEQYPALIEGYDEMGNAIVGAADAWDRIVGAQKASLRLAERQAAIAMLETSGAQYSSAVASFRATSGERVRDVTEYREREAFIADGGGDETVLLGAKIYGSIGELFKLVNDGSREISDSVSEGVSSYKYGGGITQEIIDYFSSIYGEEALEPFLEIQEEGKSFLEGLFYAAFQKTVTGDAYLDSMIRAAQAAESLEKTQPAYLDVKRAERDLALFADEFARDFYAEELSLLDMDSEMGKLASVGFVDTTKDRSRKIISDFVSGDIDEDEYITSIYGMVSESVGEVIGELSAWLDGAQSPQGETYDSLSSFNEFYADLIEKWGYMTRAEVEDALGEVRVPEELKRGVLASFDALYAPAQRAMESATSTGKWRKWTAAPGGIRDAFYEDFGFEGDALIEAYLSGTLSEAVSLLGFDTDEEKEAYIAAVAKRLDEIFDIDYNELVKDIGQEGLVSLSQTYDEDVMATMVEFLNASDISADAKSVLATSDLTSLGGMIDAVAMLTREAGYSVEDAQALVVSAYNYRSRGTESVIGDIEFDDGGRKLAEVEDLSQSRVLALYLKNREKEGANIASAINTLKTGIIPEEKVLEGLIKDFPEATYILEQLANKLITTSEAAAMLEESLSFSRISSTVKALKDPLDSIKELTDKGIGEGSRQYDASLMQIGGILGLDASVVESNLSTITEALDGNYASYLKLIKLASGNDIDDATFFTDLSPEEISQSADALEALGATLVYYTKEVDGVEETWATFTLLNEADYDGLLLGSKKYVSSLDEQEQLLRVISMLERDRSKAAKKATNARTGQERKEALEEELDIISSQIIAQEKLAEAREKQVTDMMDGEEAQKYFASGALSYDDETGLLGVNQEKLKGMGLNEEEGAAFESLVDKLVSLGVEAEAARDAVDELVISQRSLIEELNKPGEFLAISDLATYSTEMDSAAETLRNAYQTLSSGGDLTKSQLDNLLKTFPELTSSISQYSRGVKSLAEFQKDMNKALSEQGLRKLVGVLETNVKALKDAKEGTKEYAEAIENLGNAMGFSSEDTIKNIDLFKKAIDGSYEAMVELQAMALAPIVQEFLINGSANVDFSSLLSGIAVTEESAEILRAKLASLGLTVEYKDVSSTIEYPVAQPGVGGVSLMTAVKRETVTSKIAVIKPASEGAFGSSFPAPRGGGGGGGKGGGGGGKWDNGYDKQYNLLQKINQQLRKRELLERAIAEAASPMDVTKNLQEQQKLVEQTKTDYETLLKNRKAEMAQALKDNRKLASYATYDAATGQIMINWSKINKVKKSKDGEKIDTYISLLEKIQGQIKEAEDGLNDQTDVLKDLETIFREDYLSLEQRTYDAMVKREQETLDSLSKINDSINDANTRLINSIRKEIDRMREERENERTEKELADKMKRLALLQRDTSGVFELEIRQLKDEIEKEQESYSDTLVDQILQRMQDEFDEAADDRSRNIQLLQNQKDWRAENGFYWAQTIALLGGSEKSLREFLQTYDESYKAMSPEAQKQYLENLAQQYNLAIGWYVKQYGKMPSFDTGGLATYTGLANIHGTPTRPELVLNATDTKNFLVLKDVLNDFLKGYGGSTTNNEGSTVYIDISVNVDEIANSYSVDEMLAQIKKEIATEASYRNVNIITRNQG